MTTFSLEDALQVATPPETGLPWLRGGDAGAIGLAPGDMSIDGAHIAALERDPGAERRFDASGCAVVPGFVDPHTHLPFAGWRAQEYEQKVPVL